MSDVQKKQTAPPSEDRRWKLVNATMRKHGYAASALIETLHTAQDSFGHLDESGLKYIAESLNLPPSKVFGVATFYNLFTMVPRGHHTLTICTGTTCYVKGADQILAFMAEEFHLMPGQTTPDGELSLVAAHCLGACGMAPVVVLDGEIVGKLSIEQLKVRIREWLNQ